MGDFIKKWFHLVLIFVFAYLAGSLAGQAANQFSSAEESTKNAVYEPSQKPVALTENGIPIYSASADGNWGLSFPSPGQAPVGNTTNDYLKQFNACYMGDPGVKVIYLTFDAGYENGNTETWRSRCLFCSGKLSGNQSGTGKTDGRRRPYRWQSYLPSPGYVKDL